VVFRGTRETNSTFIKGMTKMGEKFEFELPKIDEFGNEHLSPSADRFIGKKIDDWWVKAKLDSGLYLLSKGIEHKVDYKRCTEEELTGMYKSNKAHV